MRRSWPLAASALALLCLLALTPSGSRAENAICASITPSHPAWGIYGCGAADSQQQEQVLEGITEIQTKLDALDTKLDAHDTKLTSVGSNVGDIESLAQMIATNLANLETEADPVTINEARSLSSEPLASQEEEVLYTAPPGRVLLATCGVLIFGEDGTTLHITAKIDAGGFNLAGQSQDGTDSGTRTAVAKRLAFRNSGPGNADDGFFSLSCTGIEIPST